MPRIRPVPARLEQLRWVRALPRITLAASLAFAIVLPLIVERPSRHLLYATVLGFAICAMSVTVITGWSGQLSLSQMAFAGIGALSGAAFTRGVELDVGWRSFRLIDMEAAGVPFVVSILLATVFTALVAALIGAGALRVRGLMLAVSTFAFSIASTQYVFRRPFFTGGASSGVPYDRGTLFGIDLVSQRSYYYFTLGGFVIAYVVVSRLRRSGIGRATIAVRDNAAGASAYTVSPTRAKLTAFALAGGLAGFGGALLGGMVQNIRFSEVLFQVEDSLRVVGMAVIGGLGSVTGAVLGAVWIEGMPAFFGDNELVPLFTSSIGLLIIIMYLPGGFIQVVYAARDGLLSWVESRMPPVETSTVSAAAPASLTRRGAASGDTPEVVLRTDSVSVRFGGNQAVYQVDVEVRRDEIVGLIGTNGAGKTTLMNAVGGLVNCDGRVEIMGRDMTSASAPRRARAGLGRTFQGATLFPELTVRETVMVALEARGRTPFLSTALHLPHTLANERRRRAESDELIDWLGLGFYADHYVSDLSTGSRRIVELAGLLALDARVLCLDEPTAGVAQRETEAFAPLVRSIRAELGAGILLIEHDMTVIMGVSDRVYCLESGSVISKGTPDEVRNDPLVVASYLGTSAEATGS